MTLVQNTAVPFLDLRTLGKPLIEEILSGLRETLESAAFTNGPPVAAYEDAFAAYVGTDHSVGVASGLDALRLGLLALDIGPGDEVILPANTFVATAEAVSQTGATPILADVTSDDWNLDPAAAAAAITTRTRALLPVHLYGQLADMSSLTELARSHELVILEDACQAHGATRDGLRSGAIGAAGAFSFYPGKNLGAIGDAGALTTNDEGIARRVRQLREHGQSAKYVHDEIGFTSRLDTIQAVALLSRLPRLDGWNDSRRVAAARYLELLDGVGDLELPPVASNSQPVWHLFVVRTSNPDELIGHLRADGIGTGRHYPVPIHLTGAYAHLGHAAGAFPVTEHLAAGCVSLPIFPGITEGQIESVVESVERWFASV